MTWVLKLKKIFEEFFIKSIYIMYGNIKKCVLSLMLPSLLYLINKKLTLSRAITIPLLQPQATFFHEP